MNISGFSFVRNADTYYYPVAESIRSILPMCDEFVIAVAQGDAGDRTREIVAGIGDPKIRILDTVWENDGTTGAHIYCRQANRALRECRGDWCFYIQADEVVHERYLPVIRERCRRFLNDRDVEGLLFSFRHFWGDYRHFLVNYKWYPHEIRIVRNNIGVESVGDAQSFRRGGKKLRVAMAHAEVFHYGYVRPPALMQKRTAAVTATYHGRERAAAMMQKMKERFDYGSLEKVPLFDGTHPAVMRERIAAFDWAEELQYSGRSKVRHKHDRFKYRFLTFIERRLLGGRRLFGYRNYHVLRRK